MSYTYIMSFLRLVMFAVSNLGYCEYLRKHTNLNSCFFPSLTIAFQVVVLFFAGILNVLQIATYALYALGIVYCIGSFIKCEKKHFFSPYINNAFLFLVVSSAISIIYLYGKSFQHYDNFSHWATVVKQMLYENRFPNFADTVIMFQEYPLGSSMYVYYVAKLVGGTEGIQMFGQTYAMLCALMACFVFCKGHNVLSSLFMFFFATFIITYNIMPWDLLVDTLLPLVGSATIIYTVSNLSAYRSTKADISKVNVDLFFLSLYLVQLIQIKNSGLFFAVLASVMTVHYLKPHIKQLSFSSVFIMVFPYLTFYLWHRHCKYLFVSAETSAHAFTFANFISTATDKTADEVITICRSMLNFTFTNIDAIITFAFVIIICIVTLAHFYIEKRLTKQNLKKVVVFAAFCVCVYLIYQIGMLLMYIFSMTTHGGGTFLPAAERYCKTILIFIYSILTAFLFSVLPTSANEKRTCASWKVLLVSLATILAIVSVNTLNDAGYSTGFRDEFESVATEYNVHNNSTYIVLLPEDDNGYTWFIGEYLFNPQLMWMEVVDEDSDLTMFEDFKYIFNFDKENPIISQWIEANYPEQASFDVICRG